ENLRPGFAAVARTEDAPLVVRTEDVAEHGGIDMIRVARMDPDTSDQARLSQANVLPGLASVGRAINAHTLGDVAAGAGRAGADIDDVRIGIGHRDRSDRASLELAVRDVVPAIAAIGSLPDAATRRTEVIDHRLRRHTRDCRDAPTAAESERAVLETLEQRRIDRGVRLPASLSDQTGRRNREQ